MTVLRYSWKTLVLREIKDQQIPKGKGAQGAQCDRQPAGPGSLARHRDGCSSGETQLQAAPAGWGWPWHGLPIGLLGSLFPPLSPVGRGHPSLDWLSAGPGPLSQLHPEWEHAPRALILSWKYRKIQQYKRMISKSAVSPHFGPLRQRLCPKIKA